jgi:uracil phosphoribosyltransferase
MVAQNVNLVSHPLVQHKLSLMREKDRSIKGFRELLNEIRWSWSTSRRRFRR